jgi:hypothetical protein
VQTANSLVVKSRKQLGGGGNVAGKLPWGNGAPDSLHGASGGLAACGSGKLRTGSAPSGVLSGILGAFLVFGIAGAMPIFGSASGVVEPVVNGNTFLWGCSSKVVIRATLRTKPFSILTAIPSQTETVILKSIGEYLEVNNPINPQSFLGRSDSRDLILGKTQHLMVINDWFWNWLGRSTWTNPVAIFSRMGGIVRILPEHLVFIQHARLNVHSIHYGSPVPEVFKLDGNARVILLRPIVPQGYFVAVWDGFFRGTNRHMMNQGHAVDIYQRRLGIYRGIVCPFQFLHLVVHRLPLFLGVMGITDSGPCNDDRCEGSPEARASDYWPHIEGNPLVGFLEQFVGMVFLFLGFASLGVSGSSADIPWYSRGFILMFRILFLFGAAKLINHGLDLVDHNLSESLPQKYATREHSERAKCRG